MRLFHGLAFWLPEKWLRLVRRIWLRSTDRVFLLTSLWALQDRTAFRWDDSWMAMGIHEQSLWVCNRVRIGAFWVRYRSKRPGFHGMRLLWPRRLRNWCTDEPVWKRRIFHFFLNKWGIKKCMRRKGNALFLKAIADDSHLGGCRYTRWELRLSSSSFLHHSSGGLLYFLSLAKIAPQNLN